MPEPLKHSYSIPEGHKATSVVAYTHNLFIWGDVLTMDSIRVSTWLRTQAVPKFVHFLDAQVLAFGTGGSLKPTVHHELFIPSVEIAAFHLRPPAQDPLDYDPNEPMRKMEPVTALVGGFRFDGHLRMSSQTYLERFLEVAKETFVSMYNIQIMQPALPNLGVMRVPLCLLRLEIVAFSPRPSES